MVTSVQTSIAEYLSTVYRPDCEYIDGEIVERNMGKWEHSRIQALLTIWFGQHEAEWHIQTATEWRTQVSKTRVRLPDILLVPEGSQPDVLNAPPILVVEILSPGDTYPETQQRAQDYLSMGVTTVWIIDPETRSARVFTAGAWAAATRLTVSETAIYVEVERIFAALPNSPANF